MKLFKVRAYVLIIQIFPQSQNHFVARAGGKITCLNLKESEKAPFLYFRFIWFVPHLLYHRDDCKAIQRNLPLSCGLPYTRRIKINNKKSQYINLRCVFDLFYCLFSSRILCASSLRFSLDSERKFDVVEESSWKYIPDWRVVRKRYYFEAHWRWSRAPHWRARLSPLSSVPPFLPN